MIILRDKRLKKFKASRLNIDEQLYKEAKLNVQKLIKNKKSNFYLEKLRKNVGKANELWKALKSFPRFIIQDNTSLSSFSQR